MTAHTDVAPTTPAARSPQSILWLAIGLLVIALVAVVVIVLGGRGGAASYPVDSPEAAFQAYQAAYDEPDPQAAYAALSSRVRQSWPYDEYLQARDMYAWQSQQDSRTWIDRVERTGDRATLYLTIEYRTGSGLTANTWTDHREVRMTLEQEGWRIDQRLVGLESY